MIGCTFKMDRKKYGRKEGRRKVLPSLHSSSCFVCLCDTMFDQSLNCESSQVMETLLHINMHNCSSFCTV